MALAASKSAHALMIKLLQEPFKSDQIESCSRAQFNHLRDLCSWRDWRGFT